MRRREWSADKGRPPVTATAAAAAAAAVIRRTARATTIVTTASGAHSAVALASQRALQLQSLLNGGMQ